MINTIKQNYKKHKLFHISAGITFIILMLLFILAQFLWFTMLSDNTVLPEKRMQIRELVKLKFTSKDKKQVAKKSQKNHASNSTIKEQNENRIKQVIQQNANPMPDVAAMTQEFDRQKFIARSSATRRGAVTNSNEITPEISTNTNRIERLLTEVALPGNITDRNTPDRAARRSRSGASHGAKVNISAVSIDNQPTGINQLVLPANKFTNGRAIRSTASQARDAQIMLPPEAGREAATIDLHALIKWMKEHPGAIPKLVAHDMGHAAEDLSSSISFKIKGKSYQLLLSCNEIEQLLRICLIEANDFTLLKDNGIKESSNFLTIGDVVKDGGKIVSIISSRQAPSEQAAKFYQIFWSWWQGQAG